MVEKQNLSICRNGKNLESIEILLVFEKVSKRVEFTGLPNFFIFTILIYKKMIRNIITFTTGNHAPKTYIG